MSLPRLFRAGREILRVPPSTRGPRSKPLRRTHSHRLGLAPPASRLLKCYHDVLEIVPQHASALYIASVPFPRSLAAPLGPLSARTAAAKTTSCPRGHSSARNGAVRTLQTPGTAAPLRGGSGVAAPRARAVRAEGLGPSPVVHCGLPWLRLSVWLARVRLRASVRPVGSCRE